MKMLWQPLLSLSWGSGQLLCPCAPTATTLVSTSRNSRQLQEARPAPQQGKDHSLPHFNLGGSDPAGSRALPAPADLSWARAGRRGEWGAAPRRVGPMAAAAQKTPEAGVRLPPQPAWPRERREPQAGPPPRPVGALSERERKVAARQRVPETVSTAPARQPAGCPGGRSARARRLPVGERGRRCRACDDLAANRTRAASARARRAHCCPVLCLLSVTCNGVLFTSCCSEDTEGLVKDCFPRVFVTVCVLLGEVHGCSSGVGVLFQNLL
ncbi:uncharacterized protein LOC110362234 isoform X2 [Columba livia]|uniref:uncharacterized protein LOC110362234 isoform X2 n=1 Tax=Columba livia TaxID=8932 RepID=UPI0031BA13A8